MKRPEGMSFEDYRAALKEENQRVKMLLKGKVVHVSKVFFEDDEGVKSKSHTYRRES